MPCCCLLSQHHAIYHLRFEVCADAHIFPELQSIGIESKRAAAAATILQGAENVSPSNKVTVLHIMCTRIQSYAYTRAVKVAVHHVFVTLCKIAQVMLVVATCYLKLALTHGCKSWNDNDQRTNCKWCL